MRNALVFCTLFLCAVAQAAGPKTMATLDRSALNTPAITSASAYNAASRLEILAFAHALANSETLSSPQLQERLAVKTLNPDAVNKVRQRYWQTLLTNYRYATQGCDDCETAPTRDALRQLAAAAQIAPARALFHRHYLDEQLRLAALFPAISSEIDVFSDAEMNGDRLKDGEFLLTFDDGPDASGGNTERLLAVLRQHALNGIFFALGEKLQQRAQQRPGSITALYQGQCLGMHGWQHQTHARGETWQRSVLDSAALIQQLAPQSYVALFRPPYGQRKADSAPFFAANAIRVTLWNIDSQDWSRQVNAAQAADRVLTLMLLWRHGIILFHDVHDKAPAAVETLQSQLQSAGIRWLDCRQFAAGN